MTSLIRVLAVAAFLLAGLAIDAAAQECRTNLTRNSTFSEVADILECLNRRIATLEDEVRALRGGAQETRARSGGGGGDRRAAEYEIRRSGPLEVQLVGCERQARQVRCAFVITNTGRVDRWAMSAGAAEPPSRVVTAAGASIRATTVEVNGQADGYRVAETMSTRVPTRVFLSFDDIASDVQTFTFVSLGVQRFRNEPFSWRDVAIQ